MSKRDREVNIQAWFDPDDAYEKSVVEGFKHLRQKHHMTSKQVIAESILFAARSEGFVRSAQTGVPSDNQTARLAGMLERLMGMIESGSFVPTSEAARQSFDEETVQFDAISTSVGRRYQPMSFEDED